MKTAISIPEEIFVSADHLAKRLNMSRSELYTRAIQQYIAECRYTGVKEKLDQVYASENASVDPAVLNAQAISIPMEEW
ncbi:MAG: CopG family transcriptional regulator [Deltaproteobacteria bacterium]|nr:CopG family transcriptional regulator [Deltaproteobacteria bacterium]